MSTAPEPQIDVNVIEQERRKLARRLEEVAKLTENDLPPSQFYGEMLRRLLESLAAPAGAVWLRTPQGNLQLAFQINMREVGFDRTEDGRKAHEALLRQLMVQPKPIHLMPHSGSGAAQNGGPAPGNPTDFILLVAPILLATEQMGGLIEVWQHPNRPLNAIPGFLQFMTLMADLGTRYQRNQKLGQMEGQQALWTQLENFARQVHGSLNPVEVSYLVANEGRRLIECDRVCVAVRHGRKVAVEAVSGADIVEKRSNIIVTLRKLCTQVMLWGERLVFNGTRDDSLPPKVLKALDTYLAAQEGSSPKLLVIQPLRDERDKDTKRLPRSVLVMECFDLANDPQQYISRMEIVSRHVTSALYNAVEYKRIPMRFVWKPIGAVQEGLGGKAKAITLGVLAALTMLGAAMWFVPYPLKLEGEGRLWPAVRRYVYSPVPGTVRQFDVKPAQIIPEHHTLAHMYDVQLETKISALEGEISAARREAEELDRQTTGGGLSQQEKVRLRTERDSKIEIARRKTSQLDALRERTNSQRERPGVFFLRSPTFTNEESFRVGRREWTVLNANFERELINREVKPSDPLLHLGAKDGPWEIELRIPQKHYGQVRLAFDRLKKQELDVDFLLRTDPTHLFKGKLAKDRIANEATTNPQETGTDSEPYYLAFVRLDPKTDPEYRVPKELLAGGAEVRAKVRCGNHRLGYSMFYGVWEFICEKVLFFF